MLYSNAWRRICGILIPLYLSIALQSQSCWFSTDPVSPETEGTSAWGWWRWCMPRLPEGSEMKNETSKLSFCFPLILVADTHILNSPLVGSRTAAQSEAEQSEPPDLWTSRRAAGTHKRTQTHTSFVIENPRSVASYSCVSQYGRSAWKKIPKQFTLIHFIHSCSLYLWFCIYLILFNVLYHLDLESEKKVWFIHSFQLNSSGLILSNT